ELHTAAVCLYPYQLAAAKSALDQIGASNRIRLACVATGFPSGQYGLESRLAEIRWAVEQGANEVDIVINRTLALQGRWSDVYEEACGPSVCLKTILGVGELAAYETVYKASLVCMYAGADFIKTSTGKESVNATLPLSLVMLRAISEFHARTGPASGNPGLRRNALDYLHLVQFALGPDWLQPNLLRIGASSLLGEIEKSAFRLLIGRDATAGDLPMA
uniref:deoxyribose-phosphate aldolase n=1 Tax=Macrostomum lignano TaxID=282301 RepID=A0A1I8FRX9_9PLAT